MGSRPENGMYIILGEVNLLVTAMRRNSRWTSHSHHDDEQDPLLSSFSQLKELLNSVSDLSEFAPNEFLSPFLDVIRSEDTTGPITGLALSSVNKFLSYGLIDPNSDSAGAAIENIADAITHARFVGTDPGSDEVVLMKILYVLRTLLLTPAGSKLTNESVCEIMQSCFRICFEMRLSELLRKSAEHTLMDMVQLLFARLPQFKEDPKWALVGRKLKMRAGVMESTRSGKKKKSPKSRHKRGNQSHHSSSTSSSHHSVVQSVTSQTAASASGDYASQQKEELAITTEQQMGRDVLPTPPPSEVASPSDDDPIQDVIGTTPVAHGVKVVDIQQQFQDADDAEYGLEAEGDGMETEKRGYEGKENAEEQEEEDTLGPSGMATLKVSTSEADLSVTTSDIGEDMDASTLSESERPSESTAQEVDYINPRGVRFTPHEQSKDGGGPLIPYGLPCVRELFRFLVSLTSPLDRHNTDVMIHMGLSLLTVALESGADYIPTFPSLLSLVKDDMCRNLFFLLQSERLSLFAASIRVCFLLFEALRSQLKFQLEMYFTKLMDIIVSESPRISYEQHEIALESLVQLLRIPGLVTELYLNYDCDLYCTNLFEDLMKLLSKNAFPVSGLFSTHLLSLDALLAVIDSIEQHCHHRVLHSSKNGPDDQRSENAPHRVAMEVETAAEKKEALKKQQIRPNRMKPSDHIPSEEELIAIKNKKKLYQSGTEQFNVKPAKGIAFLQEHGLLSTPLDPGELVTFLKENPKLDKKQIGEYISSKKNGTMLEAYQKSFNYEDARIDEALRMFLETFRLPGEAPVISYIMEHFSDHWHKMNNEPFAHSDAAFTLAYAVIMLNVDQHNLNAKKQNIPMTVDDFKKNLKGVNGGQNFDDDMLNEIFEGIRNEEIVMPAEQTGLVKENYLWKIILKRGVTKEGDFLHIPTGHYDRDLFAIVWGPTVAALSFVFDKSLDETIVQKAVSGFRKCAMISAHYGLSDVFDNLVISLCKFTTLLSAPESPESIAIYFGQNVKAQLAAKTVFGLAHRHGDILREGWKNILDCMLQLFRAKLLPEILVKVEDFVNPTGRISLVQEEPVVAQRADTGVLSSFYNYFTLTETSNQRGPSPEEQESTRQAQCCLEDCHVENLITESKFLRVDSLQELIKALIFASRYPDVTDSMNGAHCEEESAGLAAVFYLELLIKVILQNRDRISPFWQSIRDHLYSLIVNANENTFLVERAVVGLLRLAIRLLRREEIASQVLNSLGMLLMMKPQVIHNVSRQISYGLHDLLKTNAANIHLYQDWYTLFTLLEVVGAGADPPPFMQVAMGVDVQEVMTDAGAQSDSELTNDKLDSASESGVERDYTSDSELYIRDSPSKQRHAPHSAEFSEVRMQHSNGSWYMVGKEVNKEEVENGKATTTSVSSTGSITGSRGLPVNQYSIALNQDLKQHDARSLLKSCETLAFLVRDAAHITPQNFESCVHCIRTFVEASLNGGHHQVKHIRPSSIRETKRSKSKRKEDKLKKSKSSPSHLSNVHDSDEEKELTDGYHSLSLQLLDLMHTLHTRAAKIFSAWAQEQQKDRAEEEMAVHKEPYMVGFESEETATGALWAKCWCPLLQGIARLCCDSRRQVRSSALTYLQRALLVHDLQTLSAAEWEDCFNKVLFPLLSKLLDTINNQDPSGIEETRMRAATLLCKVFLQHLTPLLSLSTFTALWLTILEFMDKYMHADSSDLLSEAIPELLKNMLLVMYTAGILSSSNEDMQLWKLTWDRIHTFLPNLRDDVFKPHEIGPRKPKESTTEKNSANPQGGSSSQPTTTQPQPASEPPIQEPPPTAPSPPPSDGPEKCVTPPRDQSCSPVGSPHRSASPLTATEGIPVSTGTYILHPPLPNVSSPAGSTTTSVVPLLLNPDIMQTANYPIISPQSTPERKPEMTSQGQ